MTALIPTAPPGPLRRARAAVAIGFALYGLGSGVWFVHIPVVSARLAIAPAVLGLALLAGNLVALAAQPICAGLVSRLGSRRGTMIAMPLAVASFPLPVLAGSMPAFVAALLWLGATGTFFNVAINTQAVEVEIAAGRPLMSQFHGFFSTGSLIAAGTASLLIAGGLGDGRGALGVAAVSVALALFASRGLIPGAARAVPPARRRFSLPSGALLGFALLALLCNSVEGAVASWSALFLVQAKGATPSAAALGFACYSLAMAAGRFSGGAARCAARGASRRLRRRRAGRDRHRDRDPRAVAPGLGRGLPRRGAWRRQRDTGAACRRQPNPGGGHVERHRGSDERRHDRLSRLPADRRRDRAGLRPDARARRCRALRARRRDYRRPAALADDRAGLGGDLVEIG